LTVDILTVDILTVDILTVNNLTVDILTVDILTVDILTVDILTVDILTVNILTVDILTVDILTVDILTVDILTADILQCSTNTIKQGIGENGTAFRSNPPDPQTILFVPARFVADSLPRKVAESETEMVLVIYHFFAFAEEMFHAHF
jgi:hypothetical protein